MYPTINSRGRSAGGNLTKPSYKKSERLLPDVDDFHYSRKHIIKREGWFEKRWNQLAHFLFEDSLISLLIGLICACISFAVDISYEHLLFARRTLFEKANDYIPLLGLIFWMLFLVVLVSIAAITCKYLSREAVGSGIPNIRVIMDGFMLANYFSIRTLIAKVIGLIFTLGSGLPIGKEGPFIHIGAITAAALSKLGQKIRGNSIISSQSRDIQNILSGCAVGIACTFSAPVGAVLYAIECTSRFSAIKNLWRSFLATTTAALVFKYLNTYVAPDNIGKTILAYYETHLPNRVFVVAEIPIFVLLGIGCGVLGSAFVAVYKNIYMFRKNNRIYKKIFGSSSFDISFTIFVAFCVSLITYPGDGGLGQFIGGKFTLREQLSDFISNCTMSGMHSVGSCSDDIVYRWTPHAFGKSFSHFYALIGFLIVNFFVVAMCIGLAVPASMFVPTFVLGSCAGRIVGEALYILFPNGIGNNPIYPGLYAIVGAAAFTGAVTHSISIAVIVVEATGQLSSIVPVLIALMIATTVAGLLTPNIYDIMVQLKNYPHLGELPPNRAIVHEILVEQFMEYEPVAIPMNITYIDLKKLLIMTKDIKTYPIINNKEERILLGTVARRYLHFLLLQKIGPDPIILGQTATDHPGMLRKRSSAGNLNMLLTNRSLSGNTLLSTSPLHQDLSEKMSPLAPLLRQQNTVPDMREAKAIESRKRAKRNDIVEFDSEAIEPIPCQLVRGTSLFKLYNLFLLLGLREVFVSDRGRLIGKVSYNELKDVVEEVYQGKAAQKYAIAAAYANQAA
uniref:Chloride channel protein n=1 Tax=Panagrolaimus sp. JU765 TaxID=591449 RepID=A0AC34R6X5_9BILA